jgi:1-acyl-sn-glycerol-3-phosphate acyltransferase
MNETIQPPVKKRKKVKAHLWFTHLMRYTVGHSLIRKYNIVAKNRELIKTLEPPFLVLSNHCCVVDPFVLYTYMPGTMYWITTDAPFRRPVVRLLLNNVGCIPKAKAISDSEPVWQLMNVKKGNGVIGIFPEGQSSHDGHTLPLIYSTSKLIKLLKIPILIVNVEGTYFTIPRWAKHHRKGKAAIHFKEVIPADFIKQSSVDDIHARISAAVEHDEFEYQRGKMIEYKGDALAENLEEALFVCCGCRSIATVNSKGDTFTCSKCGYSVSYNVYGFFEPLSGEMKFDTVRAWNDWQLDFLKEYLQTKVKEKSDGPLIEDNNARVMTGYRTQKLKEFHTGRIVLYRDRMVLDPDKGVPFEFPISEIEGINTQDQERMEFYHKNVLYRFSFDSRRSSIYKWVRALELLQEILQLGS